MARWNVGYVWKGIGLLAFIAAMLVAMTFGPLLRSEPDRGPRVDLPAMTNVPPADTKIEVR